MVEASRAARVDGGMICAHQACCWSDMKFPFSLACLIALPVLTTSVFAAPGVMLKDDDLRASASATSARVARLSRGAVVEVLGRQGGWTQVAQGGRKGWVRILAVRSTDPATAGGGFGGLVEAGTRRSDGGRVVATAGLRGLDEAQLKSARFDAGQLLNLDKYQVDRAVAEQFARSAGLSPRDLGYLPAPQREKAPDSQPSSPWGDGGLL